MAGGQQEEQAMRRCHHLDQREKDEILLAVAGARKQFPAIEAGYVFGSFLRGPFRDLDCAILLSSSLPPTARRGISAGWKGR